jgi:hypothetical protein
MCPNTAAARVRASDHRRRSSETVGSGLGRASSRRSGTPIATGRSEGQNRRRGNYERCDQARERAQPHRLTAEQSVHHRRRDRHEHDHRSPGQGADLLELRPQRSPFDDPRRSYGARRRPCPSIVGSDQRLGRRRRAARSRSAVGAGMIICCGAPAGRPQERRGSRCSRRSHRAGTAGSTTGGGTRKAARSDAGVGAANAAIAGTPRRPSARPASSPTRCGGAVCRAEGASARVAAEAAATGAPATGPVTSRCCACPRCCSWRPR